MQFKDILKLFLLYSSFLFASENILVDPVRPPNPLLTNAQKIIPIITMFLLDDSSEYHEPDDHGNSMDDATNIEFGSTILGNMDYDLDIDFFKITLTESGVFTINTTGIIDSLTQLYDTNGTEIEYNHDITDNSYMITNYLTAGVYYIKIRSRDGTGDYTLDTTFVEDDHGNSFNTATMTSLNSTVYGDIQFGYDFDIFQVEAIKEGQLSLLLSETAYMYILNADLSIIHQSADNAKLTIEKETHYIVVTDRIRPDYTRSFSLELSFDDHGNSIADATNINTDTSESGEIEKAGDFDFYKINIPQSGIFSVNTTGNIDTYGYLLDADGNEIMSNDDSGEGTNFSFSKHLQEGSYFIKVRHYYATKIGTYLLNVSLTTDTEECDALSSLLCAGYMDANCNCIEQ